MNDTDVIRLIKQRHVFLITELSEWLRRSLPTCRRRLKKWQAHTSYNHNGRYYTLPDMPHFDANGIWHFRDISFSRHGNLKQTVTHLVHGSAHGLSAAEIGGILRMNPHSFLPHFQSEPGLYREKFEGRFIWLAAETAILKKQKRARIEFKQQKQLFMPTDQEAVLILVDLLHHPTTAIKDISHRLKRMGELLSPESIREFLLHHDLLKKTTDSTSNDV